MKRRGNKSNKVPNVKLRPHQPGELSTRESESFCWAQDSQLYNNDASEGVVDLCPRPFKGIVVCATGIADKPTLFKQAVELGAMSVDAFTDRVTHLIAIDHGSAKYKCALERKIPILMPSWITECYQIWLRGDDIDFDESLRIHRLPIFSGVVLTLSGLNDIARRTEVNKLLTRQQGVYVKNLERPVKVTHLLCSGDEETEKMQYAEKFNKKGEAKIHLIWEDWFWDCLEFGGRFDENNYQVRQPRPGRKIIPEATHLSIACETFSSRSASMDPAASQDQEEPEEIAVVTRLPAVTLQVWESLLKPRGFEISSGKLLRSPSKSQSSQRPQPESPSPRLPPAAGRSVISAFRRANSFVPQPSEASGSHQPFRRISTLSALPPVPRATGAVNANAADSSSTASVSCCPHLFAGLRFRTIGEARCMNVHTAIQGSGGILVPDNAIDDDVDYVVVRLVSGSKFFRQEVEERERKKFRTECWLERCIYEERICLADEHPSFMPLEIETPVAGAEKIHLSLSGFDESETWAIRRLLRALGINQTPNFSRRSTHLLCPSGNGAKFEKANEWKTPVVNMKWLVDMATAGIVYPVAEYLVFGPESSRNPAEPSQHQAAMPMQDKAGAPKVKMVDITNSGGPSQDKSASNRIGSFERKKPPEEVREVFGGDADLPAPFARTSNPSPSPPHGTLEKYTQSCPEFVASPDSSLPSFQHREQVPSSASPSPLKMSEGYRGEGANSSSPAKVSNEVTRALQDSIASLLGKRQVSEEDMVPGGVGRGGKRVRPHSRSKMQSRTASKEVLLQDPPVTTLRRPSQPVPERFESFDTPTVMTGDIDLTEQSMRVTYEDPGERDEKKRLMSLFERPAEEAEPLGKAGGRKKGKGLVRRSLRVAGF